MRREATVINSKHLGKDINVSIFGHFGLSLILFPTLGDSCLENETEGLIESVENYIKNGRIKIYSVDSVNGESWLAGDEVTAEQKSKRHYEYNNFIIEELLPFIYNSCGSAVPILTAGCAHGAFHAANTFFRRPDLLIGTLAIDGLYNIQEYSKNYFDENCYFNSPVHYLPNLNDNYWLSNLRSRHHVYLASGSGPGEHPGCATKLGEILNDKNIPHMVDIWGNEWGYCRDTWRTIFKHFVETKL